MAQIAKIVGTAFRTDTKVVTLFDPLGYFARNQAALIEGMKKNQL